jgi:hypothetical protein
MLLSCACICSATFLVIRSVFFGDGGGEACRFIRSIISSGDATWSPAFEQRARFFDLGFAVGDNCGHCLPPTRFLLKQVSPRLPEAALPASWATYKPGDLIPRMPSRARAIHAVIPRRAGYVPRISH